MMKKGFKKCPYCGKKIKSIAIKCQYCLKYLGKGINNQHKQCPFCLNDIDINEDKCPFCDEILVKKNGLRNLFPRTNRVKSWNIKKNGFFVISIFVIIILIGVFGILGYYLINKVKKDNIIFIQEQQKYCENKYKSEYEGTGYNWYGSYYSHKSVDIRYSLKDKACVELYSYEGKSENGYYSTIDIKNLDNGFSYFYCSQDSGGAECSKGCKKVKMKTCVGDVDDNEYDYMLKVLDSDYIKILRRLGFISDEEMVDMKKLNDELNELIDEDGILPTY